MGSFKPHTATVAFAVVFCPESIQGTPETVHMVAGYGPLIVRSDASGVTSAPSPWRLWLRPYDFQVCHDPDLARQVHGPTLAIRNTGEMRKAYRRVQACVPLATGRAAK